MCYGDSDIVAQQVSDTISANKHMAAYKAVVHEMSKSFEGFEVQHIPQTRNEEADALSRIGSARKEVPPGVFLEHLKVPSIAGVDEEYPTKSDSPLVAVLMIIPSWTQPYLEYLIDGKLPEDKVLSRQIVRRAKSYTVVKGELYKRSTSGIFQRCISPEEGVEILREIHEGECGHHAAARSLVAKAFRHGFFCSQQRRMPKSWSRHAKAAKSMPIKPMFQQRG